MFPFHLLSIVTDDIKCPILPKEKDAASSAMAASANTNQGTVAVVVHKHVMHVVDDATESYTANEDFRASSKTLAVPKPCPLFKILPAQATDVTTVPRP